MSHFDLQEKFATAINTLKSNVEYVVYTKTPETEEEYNSNVKWVTGKTETNKAILSDSCPHSEITWTLLKTEMDKL